MATPPSKRGHLPSLGSAITECCCALQADALYPVVSAASIVAKVLRDRALEANKKVRLLPGCG